MIYVYVIVPEITKMYNMNEVDQDLWGPLCIWCCRCFARGATNTPLPQPPVVEKTNQVQERQINSVAHWSHSSANSHTWALTCVLTTSGFISSDAKPSDAEFDETIDDGHLCTCSLPWAQTKCGESLCETVFRDRPQREHWHWPTGHAPIMGRFWNQTSILTIHDLMCCRSVYLQCICMARWRDNTLPIKGALIIQLVNVDRIKHGFTLQNRRRNAYRAMQKHNNSQVLIKVAFPCNTHNLGKNKTLKKCYNHPTCLKLLCHQNITGPPMEPEISQRVAFYWDSFNIFDIPPSWHCVSITLLWAIDPGFCLCPYSEVLHPHYWVTLQSWSQLWSWDTLWSLRILSKES